MAVVFASHTLRYQMSSREWKEGMEARLQMMPVQLAHIKHCLRNAQLDLFLQIYQRQVAVDVVRGSVIGPLSLGPWSRSYPVSPAGLGLLIWGHWKDIRTASIL